MNPTEALQRRVEALLEVDSFGPDAVTQLPPAMVNGASAALAYAWQDYSLLATVYQFDDYATASAAEKQLQASALSDQQHASTVNGNLLLWMVAAADDAAATPLLSQLVSSFAGQE